MAAVTLGIVYAPTRRIERPSAFASPIAQRNALRLAFEPSMPTRIASGSATSGAGVFWVFASSVPVTP